MYTKLIRLGLLLPLAVASAQTAIAATPPSKQDVLSHYADIAEASYRDSLDTAKALKEAIEDLIAAPSPATLKAARDSWLAARVPYMQTEAFRFGNPIVDDWEGKVNAWPLDEGLIDYVDGGYGADNPENELYVANIIANPKVKFGGKEVDATTITKLLISEQLHEAGDVEANVATGYHAVEFLLWGQDLNGTGPGAGNRPATDFDPLNCTGGNCKRRAQYLKVATELLIDDLDWMVKQWSAGGDARKAVETADGNDGIRAVFTGLGSLSYGEMAGERIKLGLMLHDPEEEHDCFSDNTHNSHYYDIVGIKNVYFGEFTGSDGKTIKGPSISEYVRAKAPDVDAQVRSAIENAVAKAALLKKRAETIERYDQMLGQGNIEGNATVRAVADALVGQAKELERAIAALGIGSIQFEGSDSLDDPGKVGAN